MYVIRCDSPPQPPRPATAPRPQRRPQMPPSGAACLRCYAGAVTVELGASKLESRLHLTDYYVGLYLVFSETLAPVSNSSLVLMTSAARAAAALQSRAKYEVLAERLFLASRCERQWRTGA